MGPRLTEMHRMRAVQSRLNNAGREEREALCRAVTGKTTEGLARRLEARRLFQCLPCHRIPRDLHLVRAACQTSRRQQIETFPTQQSAILATPHVDISRLTIDRRV